MARGLEKLFNGCRIAKISPSAFFFSDVQIVFESMVEDINNILNSGDIPGLYANEEEDSISERL